MHSSFKSVTAYLSEATYSSWDKDSVKGVSIMHEEKEVLQSIRADVFYVNLTCLRLLHVTTKHCFEDGALGCQHGDLASNLLAIFENKLDIIV